MIREAGPDDRAAVEALLTTRIDAAMFPLTNLRAHGLGRGGFASDHPHATRYWLVADHGLVALTQEGMLMALLHGTPDLAPLRALLQGLVVSGAVGPAVSIRPVLAALGLARLPATTDRDEPGFTLDLDTLILPDLPGTSLRPLTSSDLSRVTAWRETYIGEVMGVTGPPARAKAAADIDSYLTRDSHRILLHDDQPVALTGFNAVLPEILQVGGVYTPAALRGRGYARRAVALHLAEARATGIRRAVLFAASDAAARAYLAIGFQPAETFTLFLLATPARIAA
ncbi:GNAT family N-acetyltransferase [Rhodobacter sp. SY28-1]|uniref:GNAT family N-acetyltransferase n=1 Tax=Rhodobacter sp. SY28-1 TaxID=2562317 RepID=UPI0010BFE5E2|nr:GNAT family N-acetyltransferase [Rhodobacter sp. SY28-1]